MENSTYEKNSKTKKAKEFLNVIIKKYKKFSNNEKISYLIIIWWMFVLNPMSLMCHLILGR